MRMQEVLDFFKEPFAIKLARLLPVVARQTIYLGQMLLCKLGTYLNKKLYPIKKDRYIQKLKSALLGRISP